MNYGISPDQAGKIVDRLANARNNPITAPSEATMPSNGQFFKMSEMAAPVDFMNDPRYQPIQNVQAPYRPSLTQTPTDQFINMGPIGDLFRPLFSGGNTTSTPTK